MIQKEVEDLLAETAWVLPLWLQKLFIGWDAGDSDSIATTYTDKDYRFARLTVCPHILNKEKHHRKQSIIHELLHTHNAPFADYVDELLDLLCPESEQPKFRESMKKELTRKLEAQTQDLAFAIANKFTDV